MSATSFQVGQSVNVQFGNRTDPYGYSPHVSCVILAVKPINKTKGQFVEQYLVQKTHDNETVGLAEVPPRQYAALVHDPLHCTNVRVFGSLAVGFTSIKTLKDAQRDLGF